MPKKVSDSQKQKILDSFKRGETIKEISKSFNFTISTITRQLKNILGQKEFLDIKDSKLKSLKNIEEKNNQKLKDSIIKGKVSEANYNDAKILENKEKFHHSDFFEIPPLQDQIDIDKQKNLTSKPIEKFNLPDIVFIIVDKNIELEPKLLSDYPNWSFLPSEDLNRNTLEVFSDNKSAKQICSNNQKVLKITNPKVFIIASKILKRKGISMLVFGDNLLNL